MIKKWKAFRKWLRGKKAYLLAIETVIEIVAAFLSGDQTVINFVQSKEWNTLKAALAFIFVRNGIANGKEPA